jgi:antibiotic biosynthesis monooxygenase (ABM) superfamily enzyme
MVVTVFRSRLRPEHAEEFQQLADRMLTLARGMPGFISYDTYLSEDGERPRRCGSAASATTAVTT